MPSTTSILRAVDSASRGNYNYPTANHVTPIVRAPSSNDAAMTKRILDVLRPPAGIMFPMIENAQDAEFAVASTRYPPHYGNGDDDIVGIRGCAHPFVRASGYGRDSTYFDYSSHEDLLTIVQVESESAIEKIPEIGMVDGVDCIFLGPFDISCSIGKMGQFEDGGGVMALLRRAEGLVRETSKAKKESTSNNKIGGGEGQSLVLGGFRSPNRSLEEMFSDEIGYQFVCGSVDLGMVQSAAKADLIAARKAMR